MKVSTTPRGNDESDRLGAHMSHTLNISRLAFAKANGFTLRINSMKSYFRYFIWCAALLVLLASALADKAPDKADGLAPEAAAKAMVMPPGFAVKLFAGEPDIKQPVAFCLDDRGRLWVAECYSYPNWKPEGNDRILIFEDTDGHG